LSPSEPAGEDHGKDLADGSRDESAKGITDTPAQPTVVGDVTERDPHPLGIRGIIETGRPKGFTLNDRRFQLTAGLMVLVGVLSIGMFALVAFLPADRANVIKDLIPVIFGPLVTLVGTSFAWFFATTDREDRKR
jgi:hypothetical protein